MYRRYRSIIARRENFYKKSSYGIPIWIRPVSHSAAGEVPLSDAIGIKVLSVVKIVNANYAGSSSHSEDYYYAKLLLLDTLNPSDEFLKSIRIHGIILYLAIKVVL